MSVKTYIRSDEFRLFLDVPLRQNACKAVEIFLDSHERIDNVQLHSIPSVIQGGGMKGLRDLVEKQKKKNTRKKNKKFWEFLSDIVSASSNSEFSLRTLIQEQPQVKEMLGDDTRASEKKEQKQIRRANKAVVAEIMEHILPIYFEHFNCHYFYMNR